MRTDCRGEFTVKARYIVATLLYCAAIFWESSQSEPIKTSYHFPEDDKVAHLIIYGGLAALVSVGIRRSGKPVAPAWQFWAPIVFCAIYGASDEFHQRYVPMRTCDIFDFMTDSVGALLMQIILCRYVWKRRRQGQT